MQVAVRPYLAAGVALLGASAIAMSPVAPPMPDISVPAVSSAQVNLSAAIDPLEAYTSLFTSAFANVSTIIGTEVADPAPILIKVLTNQVINASNYVNALQTAGATLATALDPATSYGVTAALQRAFEELAAGNVSTAVSTAWAGILQNGLGLLPLLTVMQGAAAGSAQNLANVLKDPTIVPIAVFGLVGPVFGILSGVGNAGQNIVDAMKAGDPLGLANAVIAGPAVIGKGINDALPTTAQILHLIRKQVAETITPATPSPSALAAAPQAKTTMVTLDVSPQAPAAAPAKPDSAETTTAAADSAAAGFSSGLSLPVVKHSLKAVPGKTGTLSSKRSNPAKQIRESIQGTVKKVTDGLKKATGGLSGKSSTAGTSGSTNTGSTSSPDAA